MEGAASGSSAAKVKEVLCVFGQRRRPLSFTASGNEYQTALSEAKKTFHDVIPPSRCTFLLQMKNENWSGEFTDLGEGDSIPHRSVIRLVAEMEAQSQSQVSKVCGRLLKPNEEEAKELGRLFSNAPSSSGVPSFDPKQPLSGVPDRRKKRAATSSGRAVNITICRLHKFTPFIPKGNVRKILKSQGRVLTVQLTRAMSSTTVMETITRAFKNIEGTWVYLETGQDNKLSLANRQLNGNEVCSRRGCLYIMDSKTSVKDDEEEGKISSEEKLSSEEDLPHVDITGRRKHRETLEERRHIISEQDEAYRESLRIDQAKAAKNSLEIQQQQAINERRDRLAQKFLPVVKNGVLVCFRLPGGERRQYSFSCHSTFRELYEYVFAVCEVEGRFTLLSSFPRSELSPADETPVERLAGQMVTVERCHDSPDFLGVYGESTSSEVANEDNPTTGHVMDSARAERIEFLESIECEPGPVHEINRANVYEEVMTLYSKNNRMHLEYPFRVRFVGEKGVDIGGVMKDLFSAFLCESYIKDFDGSGLLYPSVHASARMDAFSVLGCVYSHCYLVSGMFPDRIVFPCLAVALLGPNTTIPESLLEKYFLSSLSAHEAAALCDAMKCTDLDFGSDLKSRLTAILAWHGCRAIPQPSNMRQLLLQAANYTFFVKPAAALARMHNGIPVEHQAFWAQMSMRRLHDIYTELSVSTPKVLSLLSEPTIVNEAQECAWSYLRQFVGDMTVAELRSFLRFVTGSFVISVDYITVVFNAMDGAGRRPQTRTCTATLEVPTTYASLPEFVAEFRAILSLPSHNWSMDTY